MEKATAQELEKLEKVFVNPEKIESRVEEMVLLMKREKPEMTKEDMTFIHKAAVKYAKEVLKGKAAVLYGMSLDWAITALKDPETDVKTKRDLVTKVLGHCLPSEVHLTGGDDESRPILFQMARPKTVYEAESTTPDSAVHGTTPSEPVPRE